MLALLQFVSRQGNLFGRNIVACATGVSQEATSKVFVTLPGSFLTSSTLVTVHGCGIAVRSFVDQSTQLLMLSDSWRK